MKVYIAGPMMSDDDYDWENFSKAVKKIEALGWEPVHTEEIPSDDYTYKKYLEKSLEVIEECDAIYLVEGWGSSRVAVMEYAYAKYKGLLELRP